MKRQMTMIEGAVLYIEKRGVSQATIHEAMNVYRLEPHMEYRLCEHFQCFPEAAKQKAIDEEEYMRRQAERAATKHKRYIAKVERRRIAPKPGIDATATFDHGRKTANPFEELNKLKERMAHKTLDLIS